MQVLGIIFLLFGVIMLFRPVIEWFIKFNNSMRGVQTKITGGTILFYRIAAILWISFSLLIIFGILKP